MGKFMLEAYEINNYEGNNCEVDFLAKSKTSDYLKTILSISEKYLREEFSDAELEEFCNRIKYIELLNNIEHIIKEFSDQYIGFVKEIYQRSYPHTDKKLADFIKQKDKSIKIIWGIPTMF